MDKLDEMHIQIQDCEANHGANGANGANGGNGGNGGNGDGRGGSHPDDVDEILRLREENMQVRTCLYYISILYIKCSGIQVTSTAVWLAYVH